MKKKGDKVMEKIYLACYETEILAAFRNIEDAIKCIINDVDDCGDLDDEVTEEELAAELRDTYSLYGTWFIQEESLY